MLFFTEIEKTMLKFAEGHKRLQMDKAILIKKNKALGIIFLISILQSRQNSMVQLAWHKKKHTDLDNTIKSSKIIPCIMVN